MVKMTNVNSSPKARLPRALRRFNVLHFGWSIVRAVILLGLCFLILYPFFIKIVNGFKSLNDFLDPTVKYLPKEPTWDNWITAFKKMDYVHSLLRTLSVSLICGVLQTLISALVGYGFARFRFRGSRILFASVILVLLVPPQTILLSLYTKFRYFDVFGILRLCGVKSLPNLTNGGFLPVALLSVTGFGFRGGLFIFLMRQFYNGIPKELMEAAYVDGANVYRTYFSVIFPQGRTLMVTVFLLSFSWMWTDTFYANVLYSGYDIVARIVSAARYMSGLGVTQGTLTSGMYINTATMMLLAPLLLVFIFGQKLMVEGIENSGIVG